MVHDSHSRGFCVILVKVICLLFVNRAVIGGDGIAGAHPWFARSLVGMEVGPTGAERGSDDEARGYAERFNGRDIVRKVLAAQAEYLVIWARDGEFAYYDSKTLKKAPGLGDRDVLREAVTAARAHDLPVIAYCVVQYGTRAMREHPEFRMVGSDGKPIARVCFNSGYKAYVQKLIMEMLAYGVDGFHIDMLDQGFGPPYGCWCKNCTALFEKEYGTGMPAGLTWDADWHRMLEFRYNTSARFEKELTAFIRAQNPAVTVDYNYHGNPPFSWEVGQRPVQHAGNGDFVTGETGIWGFSALGVGLNVRFYRAATPGRPVQVAMQRGVRMYHDQTTRPLIDLRWELLTLLAHGAFVTMVDKTAYDGWLDPHAYTAIGDAFRDARSRRQHFGQPVVEDVAIYFSHRTRDWIGRENPAQYFQSVQGAHRALVYEHIPWGVILDENVTLEKLARYKVVCLPNTAILSDRECDLLRRYAASGGRILITGWTGLSGQYGQPLDTPPLADLVGGVLVRRLDSLDNHVRFKSAAGGNEAALCGGIPKDWPFLVKGPAVVWKPRRGQAIGELLKPHRSGLQRQGKLGADWPMSADRPVGPAALLNTVGKGRVLTLACSPDYASASEHGIVEARKLFRNAVATLMPDPSVDIQAPVHVEAVVTRDAKRRVLRVHLIGYAAPPATTPPKNRPYVLPSLMEDAPMFRAVLRIREPIKQVATFNEGTRLTRDGQKLSLVVEDVHEVVVIHYE